MTEPAMPATIDLTDPSARPVRPAASRGGRQACAVGMDRDELIAAMAEAGVPERQRKMRVNQLWHWLYVRGSSDFADMHTISKDLRDKLERAFLRRPPGNRRGTDLNRRHPQMADAVSAARRRQPVEVETVYIPEEGRGTLCVSSQVGCTLTCTFCHTGTQKLVRNLTAEEILAQILLAPATGSAIWPDKDTPQGAIVPPMAGRKVSNVVMMGMGEPLYNFDNVRKKALLIASDGEGLSLSRAASRCRPPAWCRDRPHRRGNRRHAGDLAARGANDELRDELVPINKKYPLKPNCSTPAGPIPACRTRGASPSNM
jgi:23S rRNA (adenine2503-C2)-methyltransferase